MEIPNNTVTVAVTHFPASAEDALPQITVQYFFSEGSAPNSSHISEAETCRGLPFCLINNEMFTGFETVLVHFCQLTI